MKTIIASFVKFHETYADLSNLPYRIGETKVSGRGLYATRDFRKGECIIHAPCISFSASDTTALMNTKLAHYMFDAEQGGMTLFPLGHAMLFNHNQEQYNVEWVIDGLEYIDFTATRDIKSGEELLVDYGYEPINNIKLSKI